MNSHYYRIEGVAIPQGSKTATVINGRAVMFDSNKKLKEWRRSVTEQIKTQFAEQVLFADVAPFPAKVPLGVVMIVRLPKPKTVKRFLPSVKPDLDKLIRGIFDSATDAGIWAGDEQVTYVNATKVYCREDEAPHVKITVYNKSVTE